MRTISVRYGGECRKCGVEIAVGSQAIHERRVGLFCPGCAPTDPEEIRRYRQEAADRKADKYAGWAAKRRQDAETTIERNYKHYHGDIAFCTQPGRIPLRDRINAQDFRALESLEKAQRMETKAESLRHVRVAGDAERRRQMEREALDKILGKGSRCLDLCFGLGTIVGVYKKSYRIAFDRRTGDRDVHAFTTSRDKSYVRPVKE